MWVAFVFFGAPAKIYAVEGEDLSDCSRILLDSFSLAGKTELGTSDMFEFQTLTELVHTFNVEEDIFTKPQKDPLYYKKAISKTLRLMDGEYCKICKQFFQMAVANQPDGSLVCWSCRDTNRWMLQ